MPKNTIADLRNHLFEVMEALKDEENPMPVDRALAMATVADSIIETAKTEILLMKVVNASAPASAAFFGVKEERQVAAPTQPNRANLDSESRELPESATRITRQIEAERHGRFINGKTAM